MDVYTIEQRAGYLRHVALNDGLRAVTLARAVAPVAAGTWVHGRRQHKTCGEGQRHGGTSNADGPIFQGLTHDLEHVAGKLRQFVQKQHAVMCERDLAGTRDYAASD